MRLQLLSVFTNHFHLFKNPKQYRPVIDFLLAHTQESLPLWKNSPFENSFVILTVKLMINIGFSRHFHRILHNSCLIQFFYNYLKKKVNPEEQKLIMFFFSNMTFFRELRTVMLKSQFDSVFELEFQDPSLIRLVKHGSALSPQADSAPRMDFQQTVCENMLSLQAVQARQGRQSTFSKKPTMSSRRREVAQFSKSERRKDSIPTGGFEDKTFVFTDHFRRNRASMKPPPPKFEKNCVSFAREIQDDRISLKFLSHVALANLALDFNSFNFYRKDFNLVTSLYVFDHLNPFGKMKVFENLLNFLLHLYHVGMTGQSSKPDQPRESSNSTKS